MRTGVLLWLGLSAASEARDPKGAELELEVMASPLDEAAPVPVAPDGTCEALAEVFAATPGSLASLRGPETDAKTSIGLVLASEGPHHDSTLMVPGYARCQVIGPPAGGVAARLVCDQPSSDAATGAAYYEGRIGAIGACLDPQSWALEVTPTAASFFPADPRAPRIVLASRASLELTIHAATPPLLPAASEFCPALDVVLGKLGASFEGTSQPALPLPGMSSCRYDDKQVACTAYAGEELEIASAAYRQLMMTVSTCLPGDQWSAEQTAQNTTFRHNSAKSQVITLHQNWNPTAITQAGRTLGMTQHAVSITLGK